MPAPASQLASLLDHLAKERHSQRRPCRIRVLWRPMDAESDAPVAAVLRNVSAAGVRLDCARRYSAGEVLVVELPGVPRVAPGRTVRVRVAYVLMPETGVDWVHGCAVVGDSLTEEELDSLAWRMLPEAPEDDCTFVEARAVRTAESGPAS